jgi:solute carrier family 10 (sodium/bile acid cotransporter), member 7
MKTVEESAMMLPSKNEPGDGVQIEISDGESPMTATTTVTTKGDDETNKNAASSDGDEDLDSTNNANENGLDKNESGCMMTFLNKLWAFYWAYDFPINILIIIAVARAYPKLGAVTLKPKITAGWVATGIIFVISGLSLKTAELYKVLFKRLYFNVFVEVFNFGVVSSIVFGVSRALAASGAIPQALADGFSIAACLPMSINAVIILTQAAHGDEAAAIFHTAVGNMSGIFLSPFLIVLYLPNATADVDLLQVFKELTYKVILPLIAGQILHLVCKPLREFYFAHKKVFKKIQEYSLVYIV